MKNKILVLGNGFDLACGIHTSYNDFFILNFGIKFYAEVKKIPFSKNIKVNEQACLSRSRLEIRNLFEKEYYKTPDIFSLKFDLQEAWLFWIKDLYTELKMYKDKLDNKEYQKLLKDYQKLSNKNLSNWDLAFLGMFILNKQQESLINWNDVESLIFYVSTIRLIDPKDLKNSRLFKNYYHFDDLTAPKNFSETISAKQIFRNLIYSCFDYQIKNYYIVADDMLQELHDFEKNFAKFILSAEKSSNNKKENYFNQAKKLLNKIVRPNDETEDEQINIDVLNFNYSLNKTFKKEIENQANIGKVNSWTNIHGLASFNDPKTIRQFEKIDNRKYSSLPFPIFGIDGQQIINQDQKLPINDLDDPRNIFSKTLRLMDNDINSIRNTNFQNHVDEIIFYGQSLGSADYSYFEMLFDQYNILKSDLKLVFYYYKNPKNKAQTLRNKLTTEEAIIRLLTYYGQKYRQEHGETLAKRLFLKHKLLILPSPEL